MSPLNNEYGLPPRLAAIDLGSNRFHLLVAGHAQGDRYRPLVCMAQKVQLGLGMRDGCLQAAAIARGLSCLSRFAPHLRGLAPDCVRAVGTQALRVASNRSELLEPAAALLGCPVEVISGEEEANLVYAVVADPAADTQLVVDIGGGSTELASGRGAQRQRSLSVAVGCLSLRRHFPEGRVSAAALQAARAEASWLLARAWGRAPVPARALGCSGTLLAVASVQRRMGLGEGITRTGLAAILERVSRLPSIAELRLPGLDASRHSVFVPGLALVAGLFDALGIARMEVSPVGLREGVVAALAAGHRVAHCPAAV